MILELQAIVVGVFAHIGDQIVLMLLSAAVHLWGRTCQTGRCTMHKEGLKPAVADDADAEIDVDGLLPSDIESATA